MIMDMAFRDEERKSMLSNREIVIFDYLSQFILAKKSSIILEGIYRTFSHLQILSLFFENVAKFH